MRGAEHIAHVVIVRRVLILVAHEKTYGAASSSSFKHARKKFHAIAFFACCGQCALSRLTSVEFML